MYKQLSKHDRLVYICILYQNFNETTVKTVNAATGVFLHILVVNLFRIP